MYIYVLSFFMSDLKKVFDVLIKATPIAYILGFCVINGYLTSFDFSEYNFLNLSFLKAGILLVTLISLVTLSVYFAFSPDTMTDNLTKSWPSIILSYYLLSLLAFLLAPIYETEDTILKQTYLQKKLLLILKLVLVIFMLWASYKRPKNKKGILFLTLPAIILISAILAFYSYHNSAVGYLWVAIIVLGIKAMLILGDIGDKNYRFSVIVDILFLIGFAFLFGKFLYPKTPSSFGGGKPYKIGLSKSQNILTDSTIIKIDTFHVLYENESRYLLLNKRNEIISTEKNDLKTVIIIKK